MSKPKLALYWAASCGGCEIAVVELGEHILDVAEAFDIVFWPVAVDTKYKDVEAMADGAIDLCLFNGAIRTSENERLAHLLREKSKVLVAFGSCANEGCIPGLANLTTREAIFQRVYHETPSTANPDGVEPEMATWVFEGLLELPEFYDQVKTLAQVVPVDYFIPGCPPTATQVWNALSAVIAGQLPPPGAVLGASDKTVCDECPRTREEKKVGAFVRPHQIVTDPERCLLEQGIICAGPATRGGCSAPCPQANMPCLGCYGPPPGVPEQGAEFLSALASIVDSDDEDEIQRILDGIVDPMGTFYRFGLANSMLGGTRRNS